MQRFAKNIGISKWIFSSNSSKTLPKINLSNKTLYNFSQSSIPNNKTSRQIDMKINQQRWKNLQNNYRSLKTSFGLAIPSTIPAKYPHPDRIFYNLQSLREASNLFPQYLFEQLKKKDSQFFEVIDRELNNLWRASKKETMEMVGFVVCWGVYRGNQEMQEVLFRVLNKTELNLIDVFQVLKWLFRNYQPQNRQNTTFNAQNQPTNKQIPAQKKQNTQSNKQKNIIQPFLKRLINMLQNKIISRLEDIDSYEYEALFKIINVFRHYDYIEQQFRQQNQLSVQQKQSTFYQLIQQCLIKNLSSIPPPSLVYMAVHYANNTKQSPSQRLSLLTSLSQQILLNLKFFNHEQLIALIYSYIKTSLMSEQFVTAVAKRIVLLYGEMSWENKRKILAIAGSFMAHQRLLIIGEAHNQLWKGKPVVTRMEDGTLKKEYDAKVFVDIDYQLVPEIYLASYQNNLLTDELCKKMQDIILNNIFHYQRQDVVRAVWLFTVTSSKNNNLQRLHSKIEIIVEGGFQAGSYTIKDISILVWSLCNSGRRNQQIYKPQAKFWDNIEFYVQQRLQKLQKSQALDQINNCSSILWAYTFNRALKFKTVCQITNIILENISSCQVNPFQLINMIAFYYSLPPKTIPQSLLANMKKLCLSNFQRLHNRMSSIELLKCLKYLASEEEETVLNSVRIKTWENVVDVFLVEVPTIQYQYIMGVVGIVLDSPLGRAKHAKVVKLVQALIKRKKMLEQLQPAQSTSL